MLVDKELIHISDLRLLEISKDAEQRDKFIVIKSVPMERRLLESLIDLVPIYIASMLITMNPGRGGFLLIYFLYYFLSEGIFGTSLGKKILRHQIVNSRFKGINLGNAFLRTLGRFIPLEPFSCLGDYSWGLHDKISRTFVITESEYHRINYLL